MTLSTTLTTRKVSKGREGEHMSGCIVVKGVAQAS
jgi:hypothetical protein